MDPLGVPAEATHSAMIGNRSAADLVMTAILFGAGCSSADSGASDNAQSRSAYSQQSPSEASISGRPPDGMRWVVMRSGLRFAVPKSWTVVQGTEAGQPRYDAPLAAFADGLGLTADQVRSILQSSHDLAVGKGRNSILAQTSTLKEVPSEAQLEADLSSWGFTYVKGDDLMTPVGEGRIVNASGEFGGSKRLYASFLFIPTDGNLTQITVTGEGVQPAAYRATLLLANLGVVG